MDAKIFYANNETPPDWALKQIGAGRLKGMTDINPQWRIKTLVENFGFCGIGWKYEVKKLWFEQCGDERLVFAEINLYIKNENEWSDSIPGIGGSKMITKESAGLHNSDECYKMAITDALSVACKMLGIGGGVYSGSRYIPSENDKKNKQPNKPVLKFDMVAWPKVCEAISSKTKTIQDVERVYDLSEVIEELLKLC